MSLCSLSKDVLIKLVTTIQEDTKKDMKEKYEEKIEDLSTRLRLIQDISIIDIHECCIPKCKSVKVFNGRQYAYSGCKEIFSCKHCYNLVCDKHCYKLYRICPKCLENLINLIKVEIYFQFFLQ